MKRKVEDILSEDKIAGIDKKPTDLDDQEKLALTFSKTFAESKQEHLSAHEKGTLWNDIHAQIRRNQQAVPRMRFVKRLNWFAVGLVFILLSLVVFLQLHKDPVTIQTVATHNKSFFSGVTEVELLKADKKSVAFGTDTLINYSYLQEESKVDQKKNTTQYNSIGVPYGKRSQLLLEDGTKIWLNAGSILTFPEHFADNQREVYLEGEGYFEVAADVHRPFNVKSAHMDIHVLGTSFNVSTYADDTFASTILLSGKVEVSSNSSIIFDKQILEPGMEAKVSKQLQTLVVNKAPEGSVSWTKRRLILKNTSLAEINKKLERFYNTPIIDHSDVSIHDTFSGSLDLSQSLQEVLQNIYDKQTYTAKLIERRICIQKR
ncbi:FecR family protein [Olivibacter ginsenosidimutans]|uniref:FecR family protein n=1 Tax=Olivibacter ginsenosidimutans TaxID=1176537 RepID=A0ABP9CCH7_9SPHI